MASAERGGFAKRLAAGLAVVFLAAPPGFAAPLMPGERYVSLGASFAAAPGVGTVAENAPPRCARSAQNFSHLTAARLGLRLVDVSCSGATTAHIIGPWRELAPQIEALTPDTRLVTLSIGGNDLGYIGNLDAASCRKVALEPLFCPRINPPDMTRFSKLEQSYRHMLAELRKAAPQARIVLMDYPRVLPEEGVCARTPLTAEEAALSLNTVHRLNQMIARLAEAENVELLKVSEIFRGHDACATHPWISGFVTDSGARTPVPYHINGEGMHQIAEALVNHLNH